ncbi:Acyl carrier protein [Paramyrothecium foliicola]|nr:Acyl carrier protein [Paramyrothecium foliicola]
MFRTAMLRSVAAASARAAVRPAARAVICPRVAAAPVARVPSLMAVRMYSAAGGLNKEEVEGRIMSLLSGFDKVSPLRRSRFCGYRVLQWPRSVKFGSARWLDVASSFCWSRSVFRLDDMMHIFSASALTCPPRTQKHSGA